MYSHDRAALWSRLHAVIPVHAAAFLGLPVLAPPALDKPLASSLMTPVSPPSFPLISGDNRAAAHPIHAITRRLAGVLACLSCPP